MNQDLIESVTVELARLGWERAGGVAVARKVYATVVGPKEALAYLADWPQEEIVWVTGTYWSEGRNALEPHFVSIPKSAHRDCLVQHVERFARTADEVIAETYAARLLRLN